MEQSASSAFYYSAGPPEGKDRRQKKRKNEKSTLCIGLESFPILSYPLLYAWFITLFVVRCN